MLLVLLAAVFFLRPPQEKTVYILVQTTESGEVRYVETEHIPTENEDESENEPNTLIVIIVIVLLLWLIGECSSETS